MNNSVNQFRDHLRRQLRYIEHSCASYDAGHKDEAIRIATVIRVLIHDTSSSTSLLTHLGARHIKLLNTVEDVFKTGPAPGTVDMQYMGMVQMSLGSQGVQMLPGLGDRGTNEQVSVEQWWHQVVWVLDRNTILRRRDIALTAANKDGGAHVDAYLTKEYDALVHDMGFEAYYRLSDGTEYRGPLPDGHLVSLRQMGYEILNSRELTSLGDA
jgi:hypothetical protein